MLVYGKIVIVIATYFRFCAAKNAYQSILTSIFKDYDTGVRPVQNADTTVNVSIRYGLLQLLNVVLFF